MAAQQIYIKHRFAGGWATDFGPSTDVAPQINGTVGTLDIPFLVNAENVVYGLDGGPRKIPGTNKLNSSALESGAAVMGIYDFWLTGTSGAPAQHRIIHVGAKIKKDDADGSFSDLFTGLQHGKVPAYASLNDIVVIASDSTVDVPKSWNGSTAQNLAGSPPNFAFPATHKNRMWAAGDAAKASRLYYSVLLDSEDWAGSGSGSIDIDPDDGDHITGIISHKNELWVFKGPYKGSIHRITGSAPTGSDAFARTTFIGGLGAVAHNTLFRFRDDVGFMWSDGSVHSLNATDAFGDFNEAALTRQIQTYLREHVNFSKLNLAGAAGVSEDGYILFTIPIDSSSTPNAVLMMDYRFQTVRWSLWSAITAISLGNMIDSASSNRQLVAAGGSDGFVRKLGQADRSIDGATAISYKVTTPYFSYGAAIAEKTINIASLGISPKNDGDITFGWTADDNTQQTIAFAQGGGDVLGSATTNQFTLGTSTLGGALFVDRWKDLHEGGQFRTIQYEMTNNVNFEDVELHSIGGAFSPAGWSTEN